MLLLASWRGWDRTVAIAASDSRTHQTPTVSGVRSLYGEIGELWVLFMLSLGAVQRRKIARLYLLVLNCRNWFL